MKYWNILMAPEDNDGGSGGGNWKNVYNDPGYQSEDAGTENAPAMEQEQESQTQQHAQATQTQVQPPVDYEKMAATIAGALSKNVQPTQAQQRPQLSEADQLAQFRQATKYFQVTPDHVNKLFGDNVTPEQRVAALQELLDASATHAITTGRYMTDFKTQDLEKQFKGQLEPFLQRQYEEKRDSWISDKCKQYKGLETAQPLFKLALQQLQNAGYQPKDEVTDTKAVLDIVEQFVKAANPRFTLQKSSGQQSGGRAVSRNMAGTVNGSGGGGSADQGRGQMKPWQKVYQPVRK